jgi:hypothetical protein
MEETGKFREKARGLDEGDYAWEVMKEIGMKNWCTRSA